MRVSESSSTLKVMKILPNAHFYILCFSDAKNMARDVNDIIVEIISEFKNVPTQGAIDFVKSE